MVILKKFVKNLFRNQVLYNVNTIDDIIIVKSSEESIIPLHFAKISDNKLFIIINKGKEHDSCTVHIIGTFMVIDKNAIVDITIAFLNNIKKNRF